MKPAGKSRDRGVGQKGGARGSVFVISAPSGAGKTTLCKRLLDEDRDIAFSVSTTTRPPRDGEKDGIDYHFVGRPEFERRREQGEFVEWAVVGGHLYGTSARSVQEAAERGQDILLDVDTQGAMSIRRLIPEAVLIFVLPPGRAALRVRLEKRGTDAPEEVARRLGLARGEVEKCPAYDFVIVNDDLEEAYRLLRAVVTATRCSQKRQAARVEAILREFSAEG
ncbi:MAG TPA: guanylate kinase [Candidatus Polarisedimenticolia bacterium]|jgi:guanylate kinase|nr:guanylate kinase [Candidatus Polarisedimenticolia bacterium]